MDEDFLSALIMFLITFSIFIAAVVQAIQGDWLPAIFLILVWNGLKSTRVREA